MKTIKRYLDFISESNKDKDKERDKNSKPIKSKENASEIDTNEDESNEEK